MINLKVQGSSNAAIVLTNELLPEGVLITKSLINSEMPELKQSQLGKILTRFYNKCLGGKSNWKNIFSYKVSAELKTANGTQNYESVFKKPHFYKIAIFSEDTRNIVAFDGKNKWLKQMSGEQWSYPPVAPKFNRMFFEPELVTFLLFPFKAGRTLKYNGTFRENNTVCFKVSLVTELGYLIEYFLDIESYCIVTIKISDKSQEFSPVKITYSDYRPVEGVYFAHKIKYYEGEHLDSSLNIQQIAVNIGVTNSMFYIENDLQ